MDLLNISPARYARGEGILKDLGAWVKELGGTKVLMFAQEEARKVTQESIVESLRSEGVTLAIEPFEGECSHRQVTQCKLKSKGHDLLIGAGGGKVLDTIKIAADTYGLPLILIPTSAATCSAWAAGSSLYRDSGEHCGSSFASKCADLVILDFEVIATAPTRLLAAGIADSSAKWLEKTLPRDDLTATLAVTLAKHAYQTLRDDSSEALRDLTNKKISSSFKRIVETNVVVAGMIAALAHYSPRIGLAHRIHDGLTYLKETQSTLHGEKVAVGVLVQQIVEEKNSSEWNELRGWYRSMGLPVSLKDLGVDELSKQKMDLLAEQALPCRLAGGTEVTKAALEEALSEIG